MVLAAVLCQKSFLLGGRNFLLALGELLLCKFDLRRIGLEVGRILALVVGPPAKIWVRAISDTSPVCRTKLSPRTAPVPRPRRRFEVGVERMERDFGS